jgi:hypothetical protein
MYAVLGIWSVPGTRAQRVESLDIHVIPFVRTLPGFIDARYGFDVVTDRGYTYLTFETEADARRFIDVTAVERRPLQQEHDVQLDQEFVLLDVIRAADAAPIPAA